MSTSEFDEQPSAIENDFPLLSQREKGLPDDFSEEDIAFAQELECLFSPQDEEVPPYFVQTLLESEHPCFQAVEQRFEQKTAARVFRRLKLRRRLFSSAHVSFHLPTNVFPSRRVMKPLVAACMLFLLVTVITTGTSFASGLAILWSGAHSGVLQVRGYPKELATSATQKQNTQPQHTQHPNYPQFRQISLASIQQQLEFTMYWPGSMPDDYSLDSVSILNDSGQTWADGPVIQLNYNYFLPGVRAHGTGHIAIREFKPTGKVLQVVQAGAAHQIAIGNNGAGQVAVYVDGQWGQTTKVSQAWVFGTRSELIYEHAGIIFWIVGDQRDGINGKILQSIAASMIPFNINHDMHMDNHLDTMVTLEDLTRLFAGDVIYQDGPDGTSWSVVGQVPSATTVSRGHLLRDANP